MDCEVATRRTAQRCGGRAKLQSMAVSVRPKGLNPRPLTG